MAFNIGSRSGWNRLWLAAVLIWGLLVVINLYREYPTASKIQASFQSKMDYYESLEDNGVSSSQTKQFRDQAFTEAFNANLTLSSRQRQLMTTSFLSWLIPSISTYLAGLLVAWVLRGFRRTEAS